MTQTPKTVAYKSKIDNSKSETRKIFQTVVSLCICQ